MKHKPFMSNRELKTNVKAMLKRGKDYEHIKRLYPELTTANITKIVSEMLEDDKNEIRKEKALKIRLEQTI